MTRKPRSFAHIAPKGRPRPSYNGVKFRSRAECAVAMALHALGWDWEYEPFEFEFGNIRRGNRFYRPDFRAWPKGDPKAFRWVEVKGYFDAASLTRLRRFARYYPDDASRLILVTDSDVNGLFEEPCFRELFYSETDFVPEVWSLRRLLRLGGERG